MAFASYFAKAVVQAIFDDEFGLTEGEEKRKSLYEVKISTRIWVILCRVPILRRNCSITIYLPSRY